jgi:hypothetical protein
LFFFKKEKKDKEKKDKEKKKKEKKEKRQRIKRKIEINIQRLLLIYIKNGIRI